jgi:hypothetical protein
MLYLKGRPGLPAPNFDGDISVFTTVPGVRVAGDLYFHSASNPALEADRVDVLDGRFRVYWPPGSGDSPILFCFSDPAFRNVRLVGRADELTKFRAETVLTDEDPFAARGNSGLSSKATMFFYQRKSTGAADESFELSATTAASLTVRGGGKTGLATPDIGVHSGIVIPREDLPGGGPYFGWRVPSKSEYMAIFLPNPGGDLQISSSSSSALRSTIFRAYALIPDGQWMVASGKDLPAFEATMTSQSQDSLAQDLVFYSGILLGLAGSLLVELLLAVVRPVSPEVETRASTSGVGWPPSMPR